MKIARKLKVPSRFFFENLISNFEVTTFLWYMKIIESRFLQKLLSVGHLIRTNPTQIVHEISYILLSRLTKMDQAGMLSDVEKTTKTFVQPSSPEETQKELKIKEGHQMLKLPIVFIHRSNHEYLKYSLGQAKKSNPDSTVYLIGDSSNNCYDLVEHHSFLDYFQGAGEFSKIYRHYHTNDLNSELFSFQRWFILKEFLIANNLEKCLYLDSDIMLYADVTEEQKKFEQFDFTLSNLWIPCTVFLYRVEALADFCQFLVDVYTKKDRYHYDSMVSLFAVLKKNHLNGGACDMTAFSLYHNQHVGEIGEVSQIIDGSVYDPAINTSRPGLEMSNGIKKIIWENSHPYGKHVKTGKEVKLNSLHFTSAELKPLMSKYYTGDLSL